MGWDMSNPLDAGTPPPEVVAAVVQDFTEKALEAFCTPTISNRFQVIPYSPTMPGIVFGGSMATHDATKKENYAYTNIIAAIAFSRTDLLDLVLSTQHMLGFTDEELEAAYIRNPALRPAQVR
jgi:hypothetical protein